MALTFSDCAQFVDKTNLDYEKVHKDFEDQFWGTKMALSGRDSTGDSKMAKVQHYSVEELSRTKQAMEDFLSDPNRLSESKKWLEFIKSNEGIAEVEKEPRLKDVKKCLQIFVKTFGCYIMESENGKQLRIEGMNAENKLNAMRNEMKLGATIEGKFTAMSSVGLRNKMKTDKLEASRKACYEGLRSIGSFICENGFVEVVKKRNAMARSLGYEDFYEYKLINAEGFGKKRLFDMLDTLEQGTRDLMSSARKDLALKKGEDSLEAWNKSYAMAGDVTEKLDPYFPFGKAVEAWGRSYSRMGIKYRGATMNLDLLDREKKYSNGFCHWPVCAWIKPDGTFQPSSTNFTSLADPKAVGSGLTALRTLMHEAGHAAHFANIGQPSPLFSQERAPTSVAYAETQSMFLDSLVSDASWRARYAKTSTGEVIPWDVIEEEINCTHPYLVFPLRSMLSVPYFEKALYEMPEEELSAESIQKLADEIEVKIQGGLGPRPLLSVPHIISDEASCYYHGYVLAEMAVYQTRDWFLKTHGYIVDNPKVGDILRSNYWECGNSKSFLELVKNLTGRELDGKSWTDYLSTSVEEKIKKEKQEYENALNNPKENEKNIDLDMNLKFVDGDTIIADSELNGFITACEKFEAFVGKRINANL